VAAVSGRRFLALLFFVWLMLKWLLDTTTSRGGFVIEVWKSKNLFTCKIVTNCMSEQIEDIIKISPKGQIVIPREVRKKLGVKGGEKLLVLTRDGDILLRKIKEVSIEEIAKKIEKVTSKESISIDTIVAEAVEWARQSK
jgi:antitoxin PrlF